MAFAFGRPPVEVEGVVVKTKRGPAVACPSCRALSAMALVARPQDQIFFVPVEDRHVWEKRKGVYYEVHPDKVRSGNRQRFPGYGSKVRHSCGKNVVLPKVIEG